MSLSRSRVIPGRDLVQQAGNRKPGQLIKKVKWI